MNIQIELLYFEGCLSWQTGLKNLKSALQLEFLGSPSIRVNGVELWTEERDAFALSCRVYPTSEGMKGWPTVGMLREKLRILAV